MAVEITTVGDDLIVYHDGADVHRFEHLEPGQSVSFAGLEWLEAVTAEADVPVLVMGHRISTSAALAWSERGRRLYADSGLDYVTYALGDPTDRCFPIATT